MGSVDNLMNDKNIKIKTVSMLLIFLVASISLWSIYGAPVWVLGANINNHNILGTTFHNVSVNVVGKEVLSQIVPLTLPKTESSCGKNQNQAGLNIVNYTVQKQSENRTVILVAYEFNGTTFEMTIAMDLLWSYYESLDDVNRTATFLSINIAVKDKFIQFYSLSYFVQHAEYTLTMYTSLLPLDFNGYNRSFVMLNYAPANKSGE